MKEEKMSKVKMEYFLAVFFDCLLFFYWSPLTKNTNYEIHFLLDSNVP